MLRGEPRPTPAQRRRREDRIVVLSNQGIWSTTEIAESLVPPVSLATVSGDRAIRRREITVPTKGSRAKVPPHRGKIEPFDWMSEPEPEPARAGYWITGPLPRLESLRDWLKANNARNLFSFNVKEAVRAEDAEFLQHSGELLAEVSGYVDDLAEILSSDVAREAATQPAARDDLRAEIPRSWNDSSTEKPLPTFGGGTLLSGYHAALIQEWWAGHDVLDPVVINRIAVQQRRGREANPARIRRAAAELKPVLQKLEPVLRNRA